MNLIKQAILELGISVATQPVNHPSKSRRLHTSRQIMGSSRIPIWGQCYLDQSGDHMAPMEFHNIGDVLIHRPIPWSSFQVISCKFMTNFIELSSQAKHQSITEIST
jgi:hypothetical protein